MKRTAPTRADVAKLAQVSGWTVSVVLNDRPAAQQVPEATRQRVLDAAAELGYVPNMAARRLRGGRNKLIGLLVYQDRLPLNDGEPMLAYLRGIQDSVMDRGYDLVLFTSMLGNPTRTERTPIYRDGHNRLHLADATVVFGVETDLRELQQLREEGYRFVYIGSAFNPVPGVPIVRPDYASGVDAVIAAMLELGHRRIGFIGSHDLDHPHDPQASRRAAYLQAMSELGADPIEVAVPQINDEWLAGQIEDGMTAVVATDVRVIHALMSVVGSLGLTVPADLSVGVLEQLPGGPAPGLVWSCTPIPREEIADRGVARVIELLERAELPESSVESVICGPLVGDTIVAPRTPRLP